MAAQKSPTQEWLDSFKASLIKHIHRGDYRGGLKIVLRARKDYPKSVDVNFQYAKLLGDWADELPPKKQAAAKRKAIAILEPMVRALGGRSADFRFGVCLNYYYQKKDYRGMHRFGRRLIRRGDRRGHYTQGVAGAFEALREHARGQDARKRYWALSSEKAWLRYGLKSEKYYFAHYCGALASALLGERREALIRIKTAARLSRRKLDDWEFKDVIELIDPASAQP
jgi:hypothetical protein